MDLAELIAPHLPALTALRRDLHAHPELGYCESRTASAIQRELSAAGVPFLAGLAGGTGVVGHLPGRAARAVALRADIDALPIAEQTGLPHASRHPGVMHACGHDGHTAMLVGAARVLAERARVGALPRPVLLLFQPAEENGAGARRLCEDGALDGRLGLPPAGEVYGQHGWPSLRRGLVATRVGPMLAAVDTFELRLRATPTHAAFPHLGQDAILAASATVVALQQIASRRIDPLEPIVVSVTTVHAGTASNILPGEAVLGGTIRTLDAEVRRTAHHLVEQIAADTARAFGCTAEVAIAEGYPVTANDPAAVAVLRAVATDTLGAERVQDMARPVLAAEDFAYYGQIAPACFFVLGLQEPGTAPMPGLHHPAFDFNDAVLADGIALLCALALRPGPDTP